MRYLDVSRKRGILPTGHPRASRRRPAGVRPEERAGWRLKSLEAFLNPPVCGREWLLNPFAPHQRLLLEAYRLWCSLEDKIARSDSSSLD